MLQITDDVFAEMFSRNQPTITEADQDRLTEARVVVVGCGGLGGFVCEYLVRLGVRHLRVIDGDTFALSNMNRQVLCTAETLDAPKVVCAAARAQAINPRIAVEAVETFLTAENGAELIDGADVVVDALDNAAGRVTLEKVCKTVGVPLVHGAVRGKLVQAAVIYPGEGTLGRLYGAAPEVGELSPEAVRSVKSCLSFVPPLAAALEVSEALKVVLGQPRGIEAGVLRLLDIERFTVRSMRV